MKIKILGILFCLFTIVTYSQESKFGVKAGINFASVGGSSSDDVSPLTGFHIGGLYRIDIGKGFDFQPELLYSLQGAHLETSTTRNEKKVTAKGKIKLHYINVPFMVGYEAFKNFRLEAGPQVGFLIDANSETELIFEGDVSEETRQLLYAELKDRDENFKEDCKSFDFGIGAGASYQLNNGFNFGVRYNLGITDIYKESRGYKNKNSVIQFSIGFLF